MASMASSAAGMSVVQDQIRSQLSAKGIAEPIEFRGMSEVRAADGRVGFYKVGTGGSAAELSLLQYEAEGLARMAEAAGDQLSIPKPWLMGEVEMRGGRKSGFIVMDKCDMGGRRNADSQRALGLGLAAMHSAPLPSDWPAGVFGFPVDGCCGAMSQPNNPEKRPLSWVEFWAEHRLGHQLRACPSCGPMQDLGGQVLARLPQLFDGLEDIQPSLIHGDLWGGNHAVDSAGKPVLFDPAAYYGHSEAEFGIINMFGGVSKDFYDAYFSVIPKQPGFESRALLYE